MEIRCTAEVDEVGCLRARRFGMLEQIVCHRLAAVESYIAEAEVCLLILSGAGLGEGEGAALVDGYREVLVRPR